MSNLSFISQNPLSGPGSWVARITVQRQISPWRLLYALTTLSLLASTSQVEILAQIGSYLKIVCVGLLGLTALAQRRLGSVQLHPWSKISFGVLWIIVAVGFFSALWSVNPLVTMTQSGTLAVFFLWLHLTTLKRWSRVGLIISDLRVAFWSVWSVVAAGFLAGQLGLLEPYSSYSGRYMGFFNNPNLTAMTAALSAAFGVVLGLRQRRWIMVASTSLLLYVVFESESRTSLLALAACFGFMMLRRWPVLALAVPVIAIMAPVFLRVFLSAPDEGALSRIASTSEDETLSGRRAGWVAALELLGDGRLGVGWGATREALNIEAVEGAGPNLSSIHNSYLQNIYELGWIGAIASLLIVILLTVFVVLTRRPGAYDPLVSVVIVGSIISLAESPLFGVGQVFPYIFWTAYFGALCLSARAGRWVDKTDPR